MGLHYNSITNIARMMRAGELTSASLTEHMLDRIEVLNPHLNAFITITADLARQQARKADADLSMGHDRGLLHGVPVALKDLFATKGIRTTCGSRLYENWVPDQDATVVEKLQDAGCVLLGKTGMYELAAGTTGLNPFYGQIENPWKAGYDPGGSSGGSAAAVSAGLAFMALGTDTGCSVREPAHCCGVVGLKPTFGLVSKAGVQPLVWTKDHVGTLARNVTDAGLALDAVAGPDSKDVYSAYPFGWEQRRSDIASLESVRIGVVRRYFFDCDNEVACAVQSVLDLMQEKGAVLIELDIPDLEEAFEVGRAHFAEAGAIHEENICAHPEKYSDRVRASFETALDIDVVAYARAQHFRRGFSARIEALFSAVDVLVGPTSRRVPAKLAELPNGYIQDVWKNTSIFNLTGHPSISVPCGRSSNGLPLGLMLSGAMFDERKLLRIAQLCETVLNGSVSHPDI